MSNLPKNLEFWLSETGLEILMSFGRAGMTIKEVSEKIKISQKEFKEWLGYDKIHSAYYLTEVDYVAVAEAKLIKAILNKPDTFTEEIITERTIFDEHDNVVGRVVTRKLHKKPLKAENDLIKFYLTNKAPSSWSLHPEPVKKRDVSKMEQIMQEWATEGAEKRKQRKKKAVDADFTDCEKKPEESKPEPQPEQPQLPEPQPRSDDNERILE